MTTQAKHRMFELRMAPGFQPVLRNPRPSSPMRPLSLTAAGWQLGPDRYGHELGLDLFEVPDMGEAMKQLEDVVRSRKDTTLVYYAGRGRVGAVALDTRLPVGWEPVSARRPYPE